MAVDLMITRFVQHNVSGLRGDLASLAADWVYLENTIARTGITQARYAAAAVTVLGGVVTAMKKATEAFGEQQQILTGFETSLHGAQQAVDLLKNLREYDIRTPFKFLETGRLAQEMTGVGFAASRIIPTMHALGEATAAVGGQTEMLTRLGHALVMVHERGLNFMTLRPFISAGVPVREILKEKLGITDEQFENIGKLHIDPQKAIDALTSGFEERFSGAMEKLLKTLPGAMNNLRATMEKTFADLGATVGPDLVKLTHYLTDFLGVIDKFINVAPGLTRVATEVLPVIAATVAIVKTYQTFSAIRGLGSALLGSRTGQAAGAVGGAAVRRLLGREATQVAETVGAEALGGAALASAPSIVAQVAPAVAAEVSSGFEGLVPGVLAAGAGALYSDRKSRWDDKIDIALDKVFHETPKRANSLLPSDLAHQDSDAMAAWVNNVMGYSASREASRFGGPGYVLDQEAERMNNRMRRALTFSEDSIAANSVKNNLAKGTAYAAEDAEIAAIEKAVANQAAKAPPLSALLSTPQKAELVEKAAQANQTIAGILGTLSGYEAADAKKPFMTPSLFGKDSKLFTKWRALGAAGIGFGAYEATSQAGMSDTYSIATGLASGIAAALAPASGPAILIAEAIAGLVNHSINQAVARSERRQELNTVDVKAGENESEGSVLSRRGWGYMASASSLRQELGKHSWWWRHIAHPGDAQALEQDAVAQARLGNRFLRTAGGYLQQEEAARQEAERMAAQKEADWRAHMFDTQMYRTDADHYAGYRGGAVALSRGNIDVNRVGRTYSFQLTVPHDDAYHYKRLRARTAAR